MLKGRYVIGVCLSRMFEIHTKRYLESLHEQAKKENVQIIVFHTLNDFYYDSADNEGAASVFSLINYDYVDALVVMPENFKRHSYVDKIIANARLHDKPVISVDRELPVDVCIMPEQERAFNEMMEHLITVHNVRRPFYMSGKKEEEDSVKRENAYCRVLERYGIPVDRERYMGYGEYWSEPTKRELDRLFRSGIKLPDAIVCANDSMAITTCDYLRAKGLSVPEDIIVTGYDGIDPDDMMVPSITTCENDYETYAEHTLDSAIRLIEGMRTYSLWHVPLRLKCAESCGCHKKNIMRYADKASKMFELVTSIDHADAHWFNMSPRLVENPDILNMKKVLYRYMPARSALCLNSDYVAPDDRKFKSGNKAASFTKNMTMLIAKGDNGTEIPSSLFPVENMIPPLENYEWRDMIVITSVHSEGRVFGYMVCDVDEFTESARNIHKFVMTLNRAIGLTDKDIRNNSLQNMIEDISLVDATTGLLSYKGLHRKVAELYDNDPERTSLRLVVSVYSINTWNELIKDFGIDEPDYILNTVKDNLIAANRGRILLGRLSDGDFILVNIFDPSEDVGHEIDASVSDFYGRMSKSNSESGKSYYIEVNAGCTTANPGWQGTFADLVKIASNELIVNRLRGNIVAQEKKSDVTEDMIIKYNRLISENLFYYHFQPIVSAKTGDIYGYEALMRTAPEIGLFPDQILAIAESLDRLMDIEKATMFNVFRNYSTRRKEFGERYVFINSIPGYKIPHDEFVRLCGGMQTDHDNIVVEMTEQFSNTDVQAREFVRVIENNGWRYAIDDYGSGNSNIVNLLKYKPNLIKIDRYLIAGIENDTNKQMFVKNIIEFAKNNDIMVIAEGVETYAEMATVIEFGVDLIQGYYTARPNAEILDIIPLNIKEEILSIKR